MSETPSSGTKGLSPEEIFERLIWVDDLAEPHIVERGEDLVGYVHMRTLDLPQRIVTALVKGTSLYQVRLDTEQPEESTCTCPHFADGHYCKHIVATALVFNQALEGGDPATQNLAPCETDLPQGTTVLGRYLDRVSKDVLKSTILEFAETVPEAKAHLEAIAVRVVGTDDEIEEILKEIVRNATTGWTLNRHRSSDIAVEVSRAVDVMYEFVLEGRAAAVVPHAQKLIERLRSLFLRFDDSGGYLQIPSTEAVDLHADAALHAETDPAKLARWIVKFNALDSAGAPHVSLAAYAEALGAKGAAVARKSLDAWEKKLGPDDRRPWALDALRKDVARIEGDVDEEVSLLMRGDHPLMPAAMLRLEEAGRTREARDMLRRIVDEGRLETGATNEFWLNIDDAVDRFTDDSSFDEALNLAKDFFTVKIVKANRGGIEASYHCLQRTATKTGRNVDEVKNWAREALRSSASLADTPELVRSENRVTLVILDLIDGDNDAAWSAVDEQRLLENAPGTRWRNDGVLRQWLIDKTASTHPTRVGSLVVAEANSLAAQANTKKYRAVAKMLMTAKKLFLSAGDFRSWGAEYEMFLSTHRMKRTLLDRMEEAGV